MRNSLQATCSSCGRTHEVEAYGGINVAQEPELKDRVKDGSLFVWECPYCGAHNLVRSQTLSMIPTSA